MPAPHEKTFKVFYSWQSDLPEAVNLKLIRTALAEAATTINADHDLNLHLVNDEATRNVAGSPDIKDEILNKIRAADVFVCDLTKVAEVTNGAGEARKYCNPNVAIELGYAVRVLGWYRVIVIFNLAYGTVPGDLPFDVHNHRCSTYRCDAEFDEKVKPTLACQSQISNATGHLRTILVDALKLIAKQDPKRPEELDKMIPEVIRRERDVDQLRNIFRFINVSLLDQIIDSVARGRMLYISEAMFERLEGVLRSSGFHLSDNELLKRVEAFAAAWRECFRYASDMDPLPGGEGGFFRMPSDVPTSGEQATQFAYTRAQAKPFRTCLDSLIVHVRENYLEIDPTQTGKEEWEAYLEMQKKAELRMNLKAK